MPNLRNQHCEVTDNQKGYTIVGLCTSGRIVWPRRVREDDAAVRTCQEDKGLRADFVMGSASGRFNIVDLAGTT